MIKQNKLKSRKGFTLLEAVVTLTIIGVLSAVTGPSLLGFIQSGMQTNRDNIARTLYLAAQNQMTERKITRTLKSTLTGGFYDAAAEAGVDTEDEEAFAAFLEDLDTNVYAKGVDFNDAGNEPYVHYISKAKGDNDPSNEVYKLLDPVVTDKIVLNDAILIEYNIKTGVVMSVFYGDRIEDGKKFVYGGTDESRNVIGNREYEFAAARSQGYYGVGETGKLPDVAPPTSISLTVHDGADVPLPDGVSTENVLYADIYISNTLIEKGQSYQLKLGDTAFGVTFKSYDGINKTISELSYGESLVSILAGKNGHIIYEAPFCIECAKTKNYDTRDFSHFIWILDYVSGDMTDTTDMLQHSIGVKYPGLNPKNAKVTLLSESSEAFNPYFSAGTGNNKYNIETARHLFNIRYKPDGNFTQTGHISIRSLDITNLGTIGAFSGTYNGGDFDLRGVYIETNSDAALFASNSGTIKNVTLDGGVIVAKDFAAGIAAQNNDGGVIDNCIVGKTTKIESTQSNAGGIAGANKSTGFIIKCENAGDITGVNHVGGIAGVNDGRIDTGKNTGIITAAQEAGGVAGRNFGTIANLNNSGGTVTGGSKAGGIVGVNNSTVQKCESNADVTGSSWDVGGIAANNDGTVADCKVTGGTIRGFGNVGGIVGYNSEMRYVTKCVFSGGTVAENPDYEMYEWGRDGMGGIVGYNAGYVTDCESTATATVTGTGNVGGIVGDLGSKSSKSFCTGSGSAATVIGVGQVGGIVGFNEGSEISTCISTGTVTGEWSVGGIVGNNINTVYKKKEKIDNVEVVVETYTWDDASVKQCMSSAAVEGKQYVGGIVGMNNAAVEDVSYHSTEEECPIKIIETVGIDVGVLVGGVVGQNDGSVTRALFLGVAPSLEDSDSNVMIFPIIGAKNRAVQRWDEKKQAFIETCFYLAGSQYSLDAGKSWKDRPLNKSLYNETKKTVAKLGGLGLVTDFIDFEWLTQTYGANFRGWTQPHSGFPYPMIDGFSPPTIWPEADSPVRPRQQDRESWDKGTAFTDDRAGSVKFSNGDFSSAFVRDNGVGGNVPYGGSTGGWTDNTWDSVDMDSIDGWFTRPVSSRYNYFDITKFSGADLNKNADGYYYYGPAKWKLIEFQEPNGKDDFMPTDYRGQYRARNNANVANSPYRYAELNAQLEGTLYQVCRTTPGAQFYYSFYHATNNYRKTNETALKSDSMSFYLSPYDGKTDAAVRDATAAAKRDAELVLIRPCSSPRAQPSSWNSGVVLQPQNMNLTLNPDAWNTVVYDPRSGDFKGFDLSYHRGRSYIQPNDEATVQDIPASGNVYLYDVWVGATTTTASNGGTRSGYGISFWSETALTLGNGGNSQIPTNGITGDEYSSRKWAWLADANTHVIGYWGVEYGWKHYYGLYTVPSEDEMPPNGQELTEFAYQSNTSIPTTGNYLSGVSFKAPGFVSVDTYAKSGDNSAGKNNEVKFVKPGDTVTFETVIRNWGEAEVHNITVSDRLYPFTDYITYDDGFEVAKNGVPIPADGIEVNDIAKDSSMTLKMPKVTLAKNEIITIRFKVKVRSHVLDRETNEEDPDVDTLSFYFKNQAEVTYYDREFVAYASNKNFEKSNISNIIEVHIDPVKLHKTIAVGAITDSDKLVDGPFDVTLKIENTLENSKGDFEARGMVTEIIPKDFEIVDEDVLSARPDWVISKPDAEGLRRITIRDVGVDGTDREKKYTYTLKYIGDAYGITTLSTSSDYKYTYDSNDSEPRNVLLGFPEPVVGISIKTLPEHLRGDYTAVRDAMNSFDITEKDNLSKKLKSSNYDIEPEVFLTDAKGGHLPDTMENDEYKVAIVKGTVSNFLQFTPKAAALDTYTFYYRMELTATRDGAEAESFSLSSEPTKITIVVTNPEPPTDGTSTDGTTTNETPTDGTSAMGPIARESSPDWIFGEVQASVAQTPEQTSTGQTSAEQTPDEQTAPEHASDSETPAPAVTDLVAQVIRFFNNMMISPALVSFALNTLSFTVPLG